MYSHPSLTLNTEMRSVEERLGLHHSASSTQQLFTTIATVGLGILFFAVVAIQSVAGPHVMSQEVTNQIGASDQALVLQTYRGR